MRWAISKDTSTQLLFSNPCLVHRSEQWYHLNFLQHRQQKEVYKNAAFYLNTTKHPGQCLRDFRAAERVLLFLLSAPLSNQCVLESCSGCLESIWFTWEHRHNYFAPTSINPQDEQDLYLRNSILQWTMQNKVALKLLLPQSPSPFFTTQPSLGLRTPHHSVTPECNRANRRMLPTREKRECNKASPHC